MRVTPIGRTAPPDSSRLPLSPSSLYVGFEHRQAAPEHPDRAAGLQAGPDVDAGDLAAARGTRSTGRRCRPPARARAWASRAGTRPAASAPRPRPDLVAPARVDDRVTPRRASAAARGSGPVAVARHRPIARRTAVSAGRRRAVRRRPVELERHRRDVGVRQAGQLARSASAVRSWSTRCQTPRYLRSGSSTVTSVSPSASSRATVCTAARVSRRSGQSTMSSGTRCSPSRRHSSASSLRHLVVDGEVHRRAARRA